MLSTFQTVAANTSVNTPPPMELIEEVQQMVDRLKKKQYSLLRYWSTMSLQSSCSFCRFFWVALRGWKLFFWGHFHPFPWRPCYTPSRLSPGQKLSEALRHQGGEFWKDHQPSCMSFIAAASCIPCLTLPLLYRSVTWHAVLHLLHLFILTTCKDNDSGTSFWHCT